MQRLRHRFTLAKAVFARKLTIWGQGITMGNVDADGRTPMWRICDEVMAAVSIKMWVLALSGTLAIPDICGALAATDGRATPARYKEWFEENVGPQYPQIDVDEMYQMRCSLLHQGASATKNFSRTVFLDQPEVIRIRAGIVNGALTLDLPWFCEAVTTAAREWSLANADTEPVKTNLGRLVGYYPNGLPPYAVGVPLLT